MFQVSRRGSTRCQPKKCSASWYFGWVVVDHCERCKAPGLAAAAVEGMAVTTWERVGATTCLGNNLRGCELQIFIHWMFSLRSFISIGAVSVDLRFLGTFFSESVLWLAGSSFGPYSWESRTAAHEPLSQSGAQLVGFTGFGAEGLGFGEPGHPYWGASGWMFFWFPFSHHFEAFVLLNWTYQKTLLVTCEYCWIFVHWLLLLIPVDGWARGLYGTAAWGF